MKYLFLISLLAIGLSSFAQNSSNPFHTEGKLHVIFDTDMGNDIDDALALDMLYKYVDQNRISLLGIINNKSSDYSTRFLDMMNTWYGHNKIPIGRIENGVLINDYVDYSKNMVAYNDSIKFYKYSIKDHNKLLESHKLYRKILAKQNDQSVIIISVGFSTNLHRLLKSTGDQYSPLSGIDLVRKKVKYLSIMAGSFGAKKRAEFNVVHDIAAAKYVIEKWPAGIVLSPFEVGQKVMYPSKSIENDFKWTNNHPLVDAYKRYRPFPYNRPTWDLTSVYYAVEQKNNLLNISGAGTLNVDEKGFTFFEENPAGKHYVLSINDKNIKPLQEYFVDLIKHKPKRYK